MNYEKQLTYCKTEKYITNTIYNTLEENTISKSEPQTFWKFMFPFLKYTIYVGFWTEDWLPFWNFYNPNRYCFSVRQSRLTQSEYFYDNELATQLRTGKPTLLSENTQKYFVSKQSQNHLFCKNILVPVYIWSLPYLYFWHKSTEGWGSDSRYGYLN